MEIIINKNRLLANTIYRNIVTSESTTTFNPDEQLTRANAFIAGWLVLINIRWSKTIQYMQKDLHLPLTPAKCRAICPIYWVRYMQKMIPSKFNTQKKT